MSCKYFSFHNISIRPMFCFIPSRLELFKSLCKNHSKFCSIWAQKLNVRVFKLILMHLMCIINAFSHEMKWHLCIWEEISREAKDLKSLIMSHQALYDLWLKINFLCFHSAARKASFILEHWFCFRTQILH